MCKEVLLIVDSKQTLDFDTTGDAIEHAESLHGHEKFDIYTLYKTGRMGGIQWKISTDTATNLREAAKAEALRDAPRHYQPWTEREMDVLRNSYPTYDVATLAENLGRTYKSVYGKLFKMGLIVK